MLYLQQENRGKRATKDVTTAALLLPTPNYTSVFWRLTQKERSSSYALFSHISWVHWKSWLWTNKAANSGANFQMSKPKVSSGSTTQLPDKQVVSCHPLSGECHLAWNCDVPEPTTIKLFNYLRNFWLAWQQNIDVSTISSFDNQENGSEHYRGNWFSGERWECHRWGKSPIGSVVQKGWIYKWPNSSYYLAVQNWSTCPHFVVYDNDSKGDSDLAYVCQNLKPLAVNFHIMEVWTKDTCKIIFRLVWKLV